MIEEMPEGTDKEEKKEFLVTAAVGIGLIWLFPGAALLIIGLILLIVFLLRFL
jgi:hypothetical protein